MNPHLTRRGLIGTLIAGSGVGAASCAVASTPAPASSFGAAHSSEAGWQMTTTPGNPYRFDILPRGAAKKSLRRIVVLYAMTSPAYDVTLSEMLRVWREKQILAHVTALLCAGDGPRLDAGLAFARRVGAALIVAMGSKTTAWLWQHFRGGSIPVVSACAKDPVVLGEIASYRGGSGCNFAFTSLNMPVKAQLAYLLRLRPTLRTLGILVDAHNRSAVETQARPMAAAARARGVRVLMLSVENPAHVRGELARLVRGAVAGMAHSDPGLGHELFLVTGSTSVFRHIATIDANARRVPVVGMVPEIVRPGQDSAVVSIGISFESNAHLAALYCTRILGGAAPGNLPVGIVSPPDIAINFLKAKEIGLAIPFSFFESASTIYDDRGMLVRPAPAIAG